jgi:DNA-binding transcriptional MerR regulator
MTLILRGRKFGYSLEGIRQWLLIYEKEGTRAQMEAWVKSADRQLLELAEQRTQLEQTMEELRRLRDETAQALEKD